MKTISSPSPWPWRIACALVLAACLLTVPRSWQCEGVDEIEYLGLAHSLKTGLGYTLYGEPYGYYPPLYPALLSLIMKWDVTAWRPMYAANAAFGALGLIYLCSWLRQRHGRAGRWAAWFALFAYYPWSFSTRYLLAEPLFFMLTAVAMVELDRMLQDGRCAVRSSLILSAGVLLAAMTKAAAVAIIAAFAVALSVFWLRTKRVMALGLAALALLCGGGFLVGWEIRSQLVAPQAQESYGRWMLKWLGVSAEEHGIIAENRGEGTEGRTTLTQRAKIAGVKLGQYVTSIARPPRNFAPLGAALAAIVLLGLGSELRRRPESPLAWYVLITLVIICLTSWVSSYHRYLYPLTPLLFLFLLRGGAVLQRVRWATWGGALLGVAGLGWSWRNGLGIEASGPERLYVMALGFLLVGVYGALVVSALVRRGAWPAVPDAALSLAVLAFAVHTSAVAALRFRLTLADATPRARNLTGVIACGQWIKQNTEFGASAVASMPRLVAFLADRPVVRPAYDADGQLLLGDADIAITCGPLHDIPAFRLDAEQYLKSALDRDGVVPVFASGDAAVYKLPP